MFTDAELLDAYLAGDNESFTDLVHRHGAMVLGVCARILGSSADAEDAFQATFIVLARRASAVRPADRVARWLYGVARRIALKARAQRERRRVVESQAPRHVSASSHEVPENLWAIVDEEASRLPDRLLSPFILCDLEGLTYREAARQLGLPEGTLSNRLASARRMLAGWLTRRGIVLPAAGLTPTALTPTTASAMSAELVASTVEVARSAESVSLLAEGALRKMTLMKVTELMTALALIVALVLGAVSALPALAEDPGLQQLEGEWTVIEAERDGEPLPAERLKTMKLLFADGTVTVYDGDREETAKVTVDATTDPKSIDIHESESGPPTLGIYKLEDNQLKICWGVGPNPETRAAKFDTSKQGGRLLVLQRAEDPNE